jgi:hypothetical protein
MMKAPGAGEKRESKKKKFHLHHAGEILARSTFIICFSLQLKMFTGTKLCAGDQNRYRAW